MPDEAEPRNKCQPININADKSIVFWFASSFHTCRTQC
jgi:hypothetical protein